MHCRERVGDVLAVQYLKELHPLPASASGVLPCNFSK